MQENQFRNKVTRLSFVLMVFVVSIHTYNIEVYGLNESMDGLGLFVNNFERYIRFLESICVPFFFIISGYLFFRNYSPQKLVLKYKSRVKTVLLPYLCWCTIYYLYYVCVTRIPIISSLVKSEAVVISLPEWFEWLWKKQYYTLWFLKDLIIQILLTPIIYFFVNQYKRGYILKYAGILFMILAYFCTRLPFNFYYLLGAYIGINYKELPLVVNKRVTIMACVSIPIWIIYGGVCAKGNREWGMLNISLVCICIWMCLNVVLFEGETKWWMRASFFCYCLHDLILEALEKIFLVVFGKGIIFALIDYVCMPIITVAICIAVARVLKSYLPCLWEILSGGRG